MKDFAAQDGKGPFADSHARRKMQSELVWPLWTVTSIWVRSGRWRAYSGMSALPLKADIQMRPGQCLLSANS